MGAGFGGDNSSPCVIFRLELGLSFHVVQVNLSILRGRKSTRRLSRESGSIAHCFLGCGRRGAVCPFS